MRLGVNGWRLQERLTGVGRYLVNLLRHWDDGNARPGRRIRLYTSRPLPPGLPTLPATVESAVLTPDWRMLPWENLRLGPSIDDDVLFCPSYSRPLYTGARVVVTTHDATSVLYPELFPRSQRVFYNRLYGWSARHATLVITDSSAARDDIVRAWSVPAEKIRVVYLAAAEGFRPLPESAELAAARRRLAGDEPFFLFVGKFSGRRSIPLLLEGFAEFKRASATSHKLVLVGANVHDLEISTMLTELGIEAEVLYPGYLTDEELNVLYNGASALISPSIYETVSLPVMEAQATGTPVVCVGTAGMREVTGGAAVLLDRPEAGELCQALRRLAEQPELALELGERGLEHSRTFSWGRTAAATMAVLEEAARMDR